MGRERQLYVKSVVAPQLVRLVIATALRGSVVH